MNPNIPDATAAELLAEVLQGLWGAEGRASAPFPVTFDARWDREPR